MDQTIPENQSFFRHCRECHEEPDLDRHSVYMLIAIKNRLMIKTDLYTMLQILSLTLFEKMPLKTIAYG